MLRQVTKNLNALNISPAPIQSLDLINLCPVFKRNYRFKADLTDIVPKPGGSGSGKQYRREVHYPDKYTIKSLPYTNLGGRDPLTGRVVVGTLGGGIKWPYLWCDYKRIVPEGSPPLIERVLEILPQNNRSAHLALVGSGDKLRYIIATENMKPGDEIITSSELARSAVKANEGDAYPLGSLPVGTVVCCVEMLPGKGGFFARGAGTFCSILRKIRRRVILQIPSNREISFDEKCVAVVGRVSNKIYNTIHLGSAQNWRAAGYRSRSGLWHRKDGYCGRKIRRPPPLREIVPDEDMPKSPFVLKLTMDEFPFHFPNGVIKIKS